MLSVCLSLSLLVAILRIYLSCRVMAVAVHFHTQWRGCFYTYEILSSLASVQRSVTDTCSMTNEQSRKHIPRLHVKAMLCVETTISYSLER